MKQLYGWQKALIKREANIATQKMAKEFYKRITPLMDLTVAVMERAEDKEAQHLATYMCSEIILGFEDKNQRQLIIDCIKETITEAEKNEHNK